MREIKARVWDLDKSKGAGWVYVPLGESFPVRYDPESIGEFTGVHDKNGKEIFEGDIVKTGDETGEVQYDPDQAAFIILFQPHNKKQKSGCTNLASTFPSPLKTIIGNIWENPELLKSASQHQRITNKGRKQSPDHIAKRTASMRRTRYENPELLTA
jgi:uncharacterized phage protein (TIGR01671 family)